MNDAPRQTLSRIIAKYGAAIYENPKRCEALLRDLCGEYRREINILMGALEERVPSDLMNAARGLPREALLARLTKRLQDQLAYTEDAARWAIDSWALALGVISSAEAETRAKAAAQNKEQTRPRNSAPPSPRYTEPAKPTTPNLPPRQPTPSAPTSPPTPRHSRTPPGTAGQPANPPARSQRRPAPTTSPPPTSPTLRTQPPANTSPVAQQHPPLLVQPPDGRPGRWMRKLRGCLLTILLIVGLIVAAVFTVPTIITLLREEQLQPSINEPRVPR